MRRWLSAMACIAAHTPVPALLGISVCGWFLVLRAPSAHLLAMPFCGSPPFVLRVLADQGLVRASFSPMAWALGWTAMLVAMTPPLLAGPVRRLWRGSLARRRLEMLALFGLGYGAAWMMAGAMLLAISVALMAVFGIATLAAACAGALVWRHTPARRFAENRCHRAPRLRVFGAMAWLDSLVYGSQHGGWCALACWPLMLAPLTASHAHLVVMVASAAVMTFDRLARSDEDRAQSRREAALHCARKARPPEGEALTQGGGMNMGGGPHPAAWLLACKSR